MMIKYVVQAGDSLWKIAKRFNTTVDRIIRLNDLAEPDKIYPRQVLRLVVDEVEETPNGEESTDVNEYIVQPGDTLFMIAQRFETTVPNLINANRLTNPDRINPGDRIIIA